MITCIIVDDEQPARELIQHYLSGLKDVKLMASFESTVDAFNWMQQHTIDLVFLDIQMPKISGLKFIQSLRTAPKIIFTTAYREYAAEAFEADALDYLVKPITQERFMRAISKLNHYHKNIAGNLHTVDDFNTAYIFLKTGNRQTKIFLKDILYIEGLKDYVKVHTHSKMLVASERLSYMEQRLPENMCALIHKSIIVDLSGIIQHTSDEVTIGNTTLPIGRVFKNEFLKKL
ncbi:MAG: LytR/AlgR family response regulator transcription factor [Parafilimonas sp.]